MYVSKTLDSIPDSDCSGVVRKFFIPNSNNWKKKSTHFPCFDHILTYFFYTPFTLWSVETYPYIWTSGIYFVPQSSQLYKIRELPSQLYEWKLSSISNKRKRILTFVHGQTFYLIFSLSKPIADNIFCGL